MSIGFVLVSEIGGDRENSTVHLTYFRTTNPAPDKATHLPNRHWNITITTSSVRRPRPAFNV